MVALSPTALSAVKVPVPGYDRSAVTAGIAHFGVGAFHRAHQAAYLDALMNAGQALDWGICGVGLLPSDTGVRDALAAQDGLYTLVLKHPDGTWEPRVIGSITEYLYGPDDPDAVLRKLSSPEIRIVSLTITEGGYNIDEKTGDIQVGSETVRDFDEGTAPRTAFGYIVRALARRRAAGVPPFTVMCCDNIRGNGDVTRHVITTLARHMDPELAGWIEAQVKFPNSMVDRITPRTSDEDREQIAARFGIEDAAPVLCEPFTQWVLEEAFGQERPPYEQAGVQVVEDVEPYELMKLRLLNASHQALAYPGALVGYRLAGEAAQDPLFAQYLLDYMEREAIPTLRPVPGIDLGAYARELISRFCNAEISDTLARLATNGSDGMSRFVLPVITDLLASGGPVSRVATVVACWARYDEGTDENGQAIDVVDRRGEGLIAAAGQQREHPTAFLENRDIFGDLADDKRFTAVYIEILGHLHREGTRATLERLNAGGFDNA